MPDRCAVIRARDKARCILDRWHRGDCDFTPLPKPPSEPAPLPEVSIIHPITPHREEPHS